MLVDFSLHPSDVALSAAAAAFLQAGRLRFPSVPCFDFVPSDYELVWRTLAALPRTRFCEWGSGWGIVTGLAELLGFRACGIEIDERLVRESRRLLADFGLSSPITCSDYLSQTYAADTYFVYCWPGRIQATEEHFERIAPAGARLVIAHGQSELRCRMVAPPAVG
jgi:protein-L-isoaspartate O-methyltransferase